MKSILVASFVGVCLLILLPLILLILLVVVAFFSPLLASKEIAQLPSKFYDYAK